MILSEKAARKLEVWAGSETWHTSHDRDMDRFYMFVDQYATDHGFIINDESVLQEQIASITNTPLEDENPLKQLIRDRVSLMCNILDFLKAAGR